MTTKVNPRNYPESTSCASDIETESTDPRMGSIARSILSTPQTPGPSYELQLEPHIEEPMPAMVALQQNDSPNTYKHESTVKWEFKNYLFTLNIPLHTSYDKFSPEDKKALEETIQKYKEIFLQDLAKNKSETIKPGKDFQILFTNDGYTACVLSNKGQFFDPNEMSVEEAKEKGYFTSYQPVTSDTSRVLSEIIQSGKVDTIVQTTRKIAAAKPTPPVQTQPQPPQAAASTAPIGLKNLGSTCYLNAAFQQWATNPLLREEILAHPEYIQDGTKNPLYKALQAYKQGTPNPLDLTELKEYFNLKPGQGDAHEFLHAMQNQLIYNPKSKLACQIESLFRKTGTKDVWIPGKKKHESMLPEKIIYLTPNKKFIDLYKQEQLLDTNNQKDKLYDAKQENYASNPDIELIHINRTGWENGKEIKIKDDVEEILPILNGKELSSFSVHKGKKSDEGHYITYVRGEKSWWRCSDSSVTPADEKELLDDLKQASNLFYTKPLLPPAQLPEFIPLKEEIVKHTKVIVGQGDITKRPGTLVNFTNSTLDLDTSIYRAGNLQPIINKLREEKKSRLRFNPEGIFSPKEIIQSGNILHAVRDTSFTRTGFFQEFPELIQNCLERAHKNNIQQISFPLPEGIDKEWVKDAYRILKEEISEYAHNHQNDLHPFTQIEIVLTQEQNDLINKTDDVSMGEAWKGIPKS